MLQLLTLIQLPWLLALCTLPSLASAQDAISTTNNDPAELIDPLEPVDPPQPVPGSQIYQDALVHLRRISPHAYVTNIKTKSSISTFLDSPFRYLFLRRSPTSSPNAPTNQHLASASALLHEAAGLNNSDAIFMLANMNFFGNFSHPRDLSKAFNLYDTLANLNGNSSAQHMLGFYYSTGVGNVVEQDQAKAIMYYTFAAKQGNERAQMALAYRYHFGIGTPKNCEKAVHYWQKIASSAVAHIRTGPPGNHILVRSGFRIADESGGIYGEGASASSSGIYAKHDPVNSDAHASYSDVLEWLDLISRKGDVKATFSLGRMHFEGARGNDPDFEAAKSYFLEVARRYWTKSGKVRPDAQPHVEQLAGKAAGYLGWMFLRGEGTEQNFHHAKKWLKRGIRLGNPLSAYAMGLMYLDGLAVPKDAAIAAEYFSVAADQDNGAAQTRLGILHLDTGDIKTALMYFELAIRKISASIEALYYLAEAEYSGTGTEPSCSLAAYHYKMVADRAEPIFTSFKEANAAHDAGNLDLALLDYMIIAEQGFEPAQANVAYLLDQKHRRETLVMPLPKAIKQVLPALSSPISLKLPSSLSLLYWTRSARQANIDAMVKMGDYYLDGVGAPSSPDKASACYTAAAETLQSAQALWNLGWMYENGLGGHEQDFHLAKRYYDQALEINKEAYLPVKLALMKLRIRSRWNVLTRGNAKSIQPETRKRRPRLQEWLADVFADAADAAAATRDENGDTLGADWADGLDEDITDEELMLELFDSIIEASFIMALVAILVGLIVYRRQRAERRAREEQRRRMDQGAPPADPAQAQQDGNEEPQRDRALFPLPGEPGFQDWVVGGVGH